MTCSVWIIRKGDLFRVDNTQRYDRQGYINRVLSSSYSLKENDSRYAEYLKEIHEIFNAFAVDGFIEVPVETVAYVGAV